jgi:hypothetical protein
MHENRGDAALERDDVHCYFGPGGDVLRFTKVGARPGREQLQPSVRTRELVSR